MKARLEAALARADEVERELANPATAKDPRKLKVLGREHVRLDRIRKTADRFVKLHPAIRDFDRIIFGQPFRNFAPSVS